MVRTVTPENVEIVIQSQPSLPSDPVVKAGVQTFENLNPTESQEFLERKRNDPKRKSKQMLWGQQTVTNVLQNFWGHKNKSNRDKYLSIGNTPSLELSQHLLSDPSFPRSLKSDPSLQSSASFASCGPINFLSDVGSPSVTDRHQLEEEFFRQQLENRLRDLQRHRPSNAEPIKKTVSFADVPTIEHIKIPSTVSVTSMSEGSTYADSTDGRDFSRQNSLDSDTTDISESGYSTTYVPSFGFRNLFYGDSTMSAATTVPPFHWNAEVKPADLEKPLLVFDEPVSENVLVKPKSFEDTEETNYDRCGVCLCGCIWCGFIICLVAIACLFLKLHYLEQNPTRGSLDPSLTIGCDGTDILCQNDLIPITDALNTANNNIYAVSDDVTDLNDDMTSMNARVTNVQTRADVLDTSVNNVNDQVSNMNTDLTQVENEMEDLETNIENLGQNIDAIQNGLLDVHNELNDHDSSLSTHDESIHDLTNRLVALEASETDSSSSVADLSSKLDSSLAELEEKIEQTQTELQDTQVNLNSVKATVDSNVNQIEDNKERLTKLETAATTNGESSGNNGGSTSTAEDSGVETSAVWKNHESTVVCPDNSSPVSCWISVDYFTRYNLQSEVNVETQSCECSCYPKDDDYSCNGALCQARCVTF